MINCRILIYMDAFFKKLELSLKSDSLVKLVLSKPTEKNSELKNVHVRPVLLKNKKAYQCVYHYEKRDETKNLDLSRVLIVLKELLNNTFLSAALFTLTEDITFNNSINGRSTMTCKNVKEARVQDLKHDHEKQRLIDQKNPWWHLLGLTTSDGRIIADMQHKFKQICKYVEIVDGVIRHMKFDGSIYISDMGAGKGYLTFALFEYLTNNYSNNVVMEGVEIRKDLVQKINNIIKVSQLSNIRFVENTIENYHPQQLDILIALHACDTATDDAIIKGIRNRAELIICAPCCHKQIRREMEQSGKTDCITKYGIFLERQAAMITDAIRALVLEYFGYKTQVMEFVEMENTPKNILLVGKKSDKPVNKEKIAEQIRALLNQYGIKEHYLWSNLWKKHLYV